MNTATASQRTTMSLFQFAAWLADKLTAADMRGVRVWQGRTTLRVYRGEDYVTVTIKDETYGGPLSLIVGRDRGFVAALGAACRSVIAFTTSGEVTLDGAIVVTPITNTTTSARLGRRTGCYCGSRESGVQSTDCAKCQHDA